MKTATTVLLVGAAALLAGCDTTQRTISDSGYQEPPHFFDPVQSAWHVQRETLG